MAITATLSNPEVTENVIRIPISLDTEVFYISETDFSVEYLLEPAENVVKTLSSVFQVTGKTADRDKYILRLDFPFGLTGAMRVTPDGGAVKTDGMRDTLTGNTKSFPYDTRIPRPKAYINPPRINGGTPFWFIFGFNIAVLGLGKDDFDFLPEGLETPDVYLSTYFGEPSGIPDFSTTSSSWQKDTSGNSSTASRYVALYFENSQGSITLDGDSLSLKGDILTLGAPSLEQVQCYFNENAVRGLSGANIAPVTLIADQTFTVSTAFSKSFEAATFYNAVTVSNVTGLPTGMTVTASGIDVTVSGTPTTTGTGTGTFTLSDTGGSRTITFKWSVVAQAEGGAGGASFLEEGEGGASGQNAPTIVFVDQTLYRNEEFTVTGTVTGTNIGDVVVNGLLLGWTYSVSGSATSKTVTVKSGDIGAGNEVLEGIWDVRATQGGNTAAHNVNYNVRSRPPSVTTVASVALYKDTEYSEVPFTVTNYPTVVNVESELSPIRSRLEIDLDSDPHVQRVILYGEPDKLISNGTFKITVGNDAGDVVANQPYTVISGSPPLISTPTFAIVDDKLSVTYTLPTGATEIEYRLKSDDLWLVPDANPFTLDKAVIQIRMRVSKPWIGVEQTFNIGINFVGVKSGTGTNSNILIYNIHGLQNANMLQSPITYRLPSGFQDPTGITKYGSSFLFADQSSTSVCKLGQVDISGTGSGSILTPTKSNWLPITWEIPAGVGHYTGTKYAIVQSGGSHDTWGYLGILDYAGKSSGNTLDSPLKWYRVKVPMGTTLDGVTHYGNKKFAIVSRSGNKILVVDIAKENDATQEKDAGALLEPDTYNFTSGFYTATTGITRIGTTDKFACADLYSSSDGIVVWDLAGKNNNQTLDAPTYYIFPSGWTGPFGITWISTDTYAIVDVDADKMGIFSTAGKSSGNTLDAPTYYNFPSGWGGPTGITWNGTEYVVVNTVGTNDYLGRFVTTGKNSGDTLNAPTYYNLPLGLQAVTGVTHYTADKFAVVDSTRDGLAIIDLANKADGEGLTSFDFYAFPSGWGSVSGVSYYKDKKFAVIDSTKNQLAIFDIDGKSPGNTLNAPTYFVLASGWTQSNGIAHYTGDKFVIANNNSANRHLGVFNIENYNSGNTVPVESAYSGLEAHITGLAYFS